MFSDRFFNIVEFLCPLPSKDLLTVVKEEDEPFFDKAAFKKAHLHLRVRLAQIPINPHQNLEKVIFVSGLLKGMTNRYKLLDVDATTMCLKDQGSFKIDLGRCENLIKELELHEKVLQLRSKLMDFDPQEKNLLESILDKIAHELMREDFQYPNMSTETRNFLQKRLSSPFVGQVTELTLEYYLFKCEENIKRAEDQKMYVEIKDPPPKIRF